MTEETLKAILADRGYYRRTVDPSSPWHSWLWVAPMRVGAIPTKLCQWWPNLTESGLHLLLDDMCELKGPYYTEEQRERNVLRMSRYARL